MKQLLLSPFQQGTLKEEIVNLLTSPNLYICAHGTIIPNEQLESDNTFWPLIQSLAKRGIYVLEEDEAVVNHSMLAQKNPFKQVSLCNVSVYYVWLLPLSTGKSLGLVGLFNGTLCFHCCNHWKDGQNCQVST